MGFRPRGHKRVGHDLASIPQQQQNTFSLCSSQQSCSFLLLAARASSLMGREHEQPSDGGLAAPQSPAPCGFCRRPRWRPSWRALGGRRKGSGSSISILQKIYGQLRLLPSLRTSYPGLRTTPDGAASR